MKRIFPYLILFAFTGISLLTSLPGCDKLITEQIITNNEYYDTITLIDSTCVAACHSDRNSVLDIARGEWVNSAHAAGQLVNYLLVDFAPMVPIYYTTNYCGPHCHTSQGYIAQSTNAVNQPLEIRCKTCHDYHTTWDYSLRYDAAVTLIDGTTFNSGSSNNCVSCHKSIRDVNLIVNAVFDANPDDSVAVSNFWGPHGSNQAEMFLGRGGYHYDGVNYSNLVHSSTFTGGCVKCHMSVTTGFSLGGHSTNMSDGATEHIASCNVIGCHTGGTAISSFDTYSQPSRQQFLDTLALLEYYLDSLGLLDTIGYIRPEGIAGALYNYRFIIKDQSNGIHNPKYSMRLASSSLEYILTYITPPEKSR